ncbi:MULTISPECIES: Na/Pi cotransporter family protein [unclassified Neorhizobium]|uniref:Na/Pi cotransporter family protein n=1 Tax=unclassified Neorhizobium TaxID=2629175 RepID=UPI001FF42CC1|nr:MULTISPECIES: Na/Pi cotransporter family protein [unclassified Neorhizobium]MCJ9669003.1 Na/Pi cotransporter family protein [Neorhizobium sp. SHOUNA12B]MCJ9744957.1 Na/Pi cotransporter family protein [Neorhizobium sp. SHOUNA12A]
MSTILAVISLFGHIALLLWGTRMVQTGIQRAYGPKLRRFLGVALRGRFRAFLAGLVATAILQSSTATGMIASGFAASGYVGLVPALAIMLGANVGTTLITQLFSFDVAAASPALILVGLVFFRRAMKPEMRHLGRVFIGLGFMLLALHQLLEVVSEFSRAMRLGSVLSMLSSMPLLSLVLSAALTWAAHSSVAVVLLVMSLAANGVIDPNQAFVLTLGANLGTAINPVVEAAGPDLSSKRLPVGNLLTKVFGIAVAFAALDPIASFMAPTDGDGARAVANFHTGFNLIVSLISLPFLSPVANILTRLMPSRPDDTDAGRPRYLEPVARGTPAVALEAAAREVLRLVDTLDEMLAGARRALHVPDRKLFSGLRKLDDVLDRLDNAIKRYVTSMGPDWLGEAEHRRREQILLFSTGLEQAGDVLDRNVFPRLEKCGRKGIAFSDDERRILEELVDRLMRNLRNAAALFMSQDGRLARLLIDEKTAFRTAEREGAIEHFRRLGEGDISAAEASSVHLDLLSDFKQINSHLVTSTAYSVLDRSQQQVFPLSGF